MSLHCYTPLLTDLYQFTMGYGYFKQNIHERLACFHLLFRKNPFQGNHALCCGLGEVKNFLAQWRFSDHDIDYLSSLNNPVNEALFTADYLDYLKNLKFSCDVDAIPEGTIVFANEPILRIQGPLIQCQLLESALLNIINFQTLIATKASRVVRAAGTDTVIEFGLRRAQGPDGALSASRAAYIGGCHATSNTLAGKIYDIPVRGTHAHSWVTAFDSEEQAFTAYIDVMPNNAVLLVDTYNTVQGISHAISAGKRLEQQGAKLLAIRLDSGDIATLSKTARQMLDAAGFKETGIFASNSLDEYVIQAIKEQGGKVSSWGVGTNLVTSYDQPALDGVYKMSALVNSEGQWQYRLKLSEQEVKISNPGRHQVRRFFLNDQYFIDVIYDLDIGMGEACEAVLLNQAMKTIRLDAYDACFDLLEPIYRQGEDVQKPRTIHNIRLDAISASQGFWRQQQDQNYPIGLETKLYDLKKVLMQRLMPA